jgi:hypothetical protein
MKNPCLAAALHELEAAGVRDIVHAPGGKHVQLRWSVNGGASRLYSLPSTPSDWRSPRNVRADVRRILRADGLLAAPVPKPTPPPRKLDRLAELERRVAALEKEIERFRNGSVTLSRS